MATIGKPLTAYQITNQQAASELSTLYKVLDIGISKGSKVKRSKAAPTKKKRAKKPVRPQIVNQAAMGV